MKTKYYCNECDEIKDEKDISYKYILNVSGKFPTTFFVCKECNKSKEGYNK